MPSSRQPCDGFRLPLLYASAPSRILSRSARNKPAGKASSHRPLFRLSAFRGIPNPHAVAHLAGCPACDPVAAPVPPLLSHILRGVLVFCRRVLFFRPPQFLAQSAPQHPPSGEGKSRRALPAQ